MATFAQIDSNIADGADVAKAFLRQALKEASGDTFMQLVHGCTSPLSARNVLGAAAWGGTSAGTGTAYTITPSPVISNIEAGTLIAFIAHLTNTGAATISVNGSGGLPIRHSDGGTVLVAGDIQATHLVVLYYDGAAFRLLNGGHRLLPGTGGHLTSAGRLIAPNTPKAWVSFNGATGGILAGTNVASVVRNSVGSYTVTWASAAPSVNYAVFGNAANVAGVGNIIVSEAVGKTAAAASVLTTAGAGTLVDSSVVNLQAFWP